MSVYSIFEPFKSSYVSFNFWVEKIQIKIIKPFLNKVNFEYSSHIQKCLQHISRQFFFLPFMKILFFHKFSSLLFSFLLFM